MACERDASTESVLVIELAESFSHFHIARSLLATEAACGKRGRVARVLPGATWQGAAGPFPESWCGRCARWMNKMTRAEKLESFRKAVTARYASQDYHDALAYGRIVQHVTPRPAWYTHDWVDEPAGTGYVDIQGEIDNMRRRRESVADGHCCTDFAPSVRALIYL